MTSLGRLLDFILPRSCPACSSPLPVPWNHALCKQCLDALQVILPPFCTRCGEPFRSGSGFSHLCAKCIENPGPIDWSRSLFVYEDPIASLVKGLKYGKDRACLKGLIEISRPLLERVFEDAPVDIYHRQTKKEICVVPVPLHPRRLRTRLFNQSLLIARGLFPDLPITTKAIKRVLNNPPQSKLSRQERISNVKNVFQMDSPGNFRCFLLVDDVVTTGSTILEMAKVLKKNGAQKVLALTVARGIR